LRRVVRWGALEFSPYRLQGSLCDGHPLAHGVRGASWQGRVVARRPTGCETTIDDHEQSSFRLASPAVIAITKRRIVLVAEC
jgi:hypothetical protein